MKIFLSWSGQQSRMIANTLNNWLPQVIQAVKPFFSPDMEKGSNWINELDSALKGTRFGIVCLTRDNLKSPWIHYEAGALWKTEGARIWTFLYGLRPSDISAPFAHFQATTTEKTEVFRLLQSINGCLKEAGAAPLQEAILQRAFEKSWPELNRCNQDWYTRFATPK